MIFITFLISVMQTYAVTTITFESDYGIKNVILFIFLVALFAFWFFVYRHTQPLEFDRRQLLKSVTNTGTKIMCWIWFLAILYTSQAVLFISSNDSFLTDKLDLLYGTFYLSIIIFGFLGLLNSVKIYNKMTNTTQYFKEFVYEIKTGGRK